MNLLFITLVWAALCVCLASARTYSYEISENSIDDGRNKITKYETKKFDSSSMKRPYFEGKTIVVPSNYKVNTNNVILQNQRNTNKIGTGFEVAMPMQFHNKHHLQRNTIRHSSKARSVESPAYSVDSGGQASSSIAGEIAKILHVKQGHYADVYSRLDRPGMTTRRPADVIEDTMRVAVQKMWRDRN